MSADQPREIPIAFPEALKGGVYSNNMVVSHTREEFLLDFLMVAPQGGAVVARVVVSPGHAKRIAAALQENLRKYEEHFGPIATAEGPKGPIGFS